MHGVNAIRLRSWSGSSGGGSSGGGEPGGHGGARCDQREKGGGRSRTLAGQGSRGRGGARLPINFSLLCIREATRNCFFEEEQTGGGGELEWLESDVGL